MSQRAAPELTGAWCAVRTLGQATWLKPGKWMEKCNFSVLKVPVLISKAPYKFHPTMGFPHKIDRLVFLSLPARIQ